MANVCGVPTIQLKVSLELNEEEARALKEICSYSVDEFLKLFYEHMGKAYLKKHEGGVRSLFETVRPELSRWLTRVDKSREIFIKMSKEE